MSDWYYAEDGKPVGPIPRADLEAILRRGSLPPETKVCAVGDAAWVRAKDVPGLLGPAEAAASLVDRAPSRPPLIAARPRNGSEGFRIHWAVWVLFGLVIVVTILQSLLTQGISTPEAHGHLMGGVLVVTVLSLGLGWLAFRTARSSGAGNVAMTTILALLFLVELNMAGEAGRKRRPFDELEANAEATRKVALEEIAETGAVSERTRAKGDEMLRTLEKASAREKGDDAKFFGASAAQARVIQELGRAYHERAEELVAAGGLDPGTLSGGEDIVNRLAMLDALLADNSKIQRAIANFPADVESRLVSEGMRPEAAKEFRTGMSTTFDPRPLLEMRRHDASAWTAGKGMLEILRDNTGHWGYEAASDLVTFDATVPPAIVDRYSSLAAEMEALAVAQQELERKAFAALGR